MTEAEFNCLPARLQEQVKRAATHNNSSGAAWNMYYNTPAPNRYRRVGELLDLLCFYDHLTDAPQIGFETNTTSNVCRRRITTLSSASVSGHPTFLY